MKNVMKKQRQYGFADLGISLLVLAISGTFALATNHAEDEKLAAQQENMVVEAQLGAGTGYTPVEMPQDRR